MPSDKIAGRAASFIRPGVLRFGREGAGSLHAHLQIY